MMTEQHKPVANIRATLNDRGEYTPAGEGQGRADAFSAREVADAFGVDIARVHEAMHGEFGLEAEDTVVSTQAQELAELLLGDQPQDRQQAALMTLGAFTPRTDHDTGLGERAEGEESDRLVRRGDKGDEERG
jgi:hypothetical protein